MPMQMSEEYCVILLKNSSPKALCVSFYVMEWIFDPSSTRRPSKRGKEGDCGPHCGSRSDGEREGEP